VDSVPPVREAFDAWLVGDQRAAGSALHFAQWVEDHDVGAFVLGGAVRDAVVAGVGGCPRDVDVVVDVRNSREVESVCLGAGLRIVGRTRFGGVRAVRHGTMFDVWALRDTWAFARQGVSRTFQNLPATTPLDIQAVAVELRIGGAVYDAGFSQALANRRVDVRCEHIPSERLVREHAFAIADRLGFGLGRRLQSLGRAGC
jgi:hypothetical protein